MYFKDENQSWNEMFTPFIQYSIDNQDLTDPGKQEPERVQIAEVVGCLEQSSNRQWMLSNAGDPAASLTQWTTSVAVEKAKAKPLGNRQYQLLGLAAFHPSSQEGNKVVVKGALMQDPGSRINVTSLQPLGASCSGLKRP